jgi:hypothetical protein
MVSRRRLLKMLTGFAAMGAGGWALLRGARANAYYQGLYRTTSTARASSIQAACGPRPGAFLKWRLGGRSG